MAEIPLHGKWGEGKVALVDDRDLPFLSQYRFTLHKKGYVRTYIRREGQTRPVSIELHLLLRDEQGRLYKDHINGDPLDNRRENLRLATNQQNAFNQKVNRNNRSGFKGVRKTRHGWQAVIRLDGHQRCLGTYDTPELAAAAYNGAAIALFGAFAHLNTIPAPARQDVSADAAA